MTQRTIHPPEGPFRADMTPPGDKSLSHRALIFAAMADGPSQIDHLGTGADVESTKRAVERLGIEVRDDRLVSPGVGSWRAPAEAIDCGNSGTTLRLLAGALAGQPFTATLTGDRSLRRIL